MIHPVAVRSNKSKPLNSTLALGFYFRVLTEGRAKWLFLCLYASAPLAILSTHDCGGEGEKRFTLTETCKGSIGKRVHEGFAPSDKQACRLIVNCCRDRISGLINKAANGIKGKTPMLTPNRVSYRTQTNHHPYTLSLLLSKGNTHMNRQEANQLLNQVREGVLHPQSIIIKALTITGDIHGKCFSNHHITDGGGTDSLNPSVHHAHLQSLEGEPQ